jgi:hypothetical protein
MVVNGQSHAPVALPSRKTRYHCMGGWVGPRAGMDGCGNSRPNRDSIPGPSRYTDCAIPAHIPSAVIVCIYFYFWKSARCIKLVYYSSITYGMFSMIQNKTAACKYSDSLRAGSFGNRTLVKARFSVVSILAPRSTELPV